jgi:hypothetical protein
VFDSRKIALELGHQRCVGAALKHLCHEGSAGIEDVGGKGGSPLDQAEDAQLIGLAMACRVGGHVGQHHIGAAGHHLEQLVRRVVFEKIELREGDA